MTGGAAIVASARGVSVERGRRAVLSGVDIEVRAGEVTVLIGPNGAGKSTLLGALAGDLPPTTGEIVAVAGAAGAARRTARHLERRPADDGGRRCARRRRSHA